MESISDIPSELIRDFMKERWTLRYLLRHKQDHPYISFFTNPYTLRDYYGFPDVTCFRFPALLSDLSSYANICKKFKEVVSANIFDVQFNNYDLHREWERILNILSNDDKLDPEKRKKLEERRDELISRFPEFDGKTYLESQSIDRCPWIKNFLKATWILYELINSGQNIFQYPKLLREADLSMIWIRLITIPSDYDHTMETKTGNTLIMKLADDPIVRKKIIIDGYYKDPECIPRLRWLYTHDSYVSSIVRPFEGQFKNETEGCRMNEVVISEFDQKFTSPESRTKFFINNGLAGDLISEYYSITDEDMPRHVYQYIKRNAYYYAYRRNLYEYEEEQYGGDPPPIVPDPRYCRFTPSPGPVSSSDSEVSPLIPFSKRNYKYKPHTPSEGSEERRRIRFKTWYDVKRTDNGDGTYTLVRNSKTYICKNLDFETQCKLEAKSRKDIFIERIRYYINIPEEMENELIKIHGRKKRFCKITIGELESLSEYDRARILMKIPRESYSKEDVIINRIPNFSSYEKPVIHSFWIQNFKDHCDNFALLSL